MGLINNFVRFNFKRGGGGCDKSGEVQPPDHVSSRDGVLFPPPDSSKTGKRSRAANIRRAAYLAFRKIDNRLSSFPAQEASY